MAVVVPSYSEILGKMLRKVYSITGLNDTTKGSVLLTVLEAAAQNDFEQFGTLLQLLDNFSLDNTTGADLDKKAVELGLTEGRRTATFASGFVTISDTTITKVSTNIYAGDNPPITGDTVIFVNDASDIPAGSTIIIGRDTAGEETVVLLGAPVDNTSFWTITLTAGLTFDHNVNETVILSQGGVRTSVSGTQVAIPDSNNSERITFTTQVEGVIEDGEEEIANILVRANKPGTTGNAPATTIIEFTSTPFTGAAVTNPTSFSNATDLESDEELRDRIKDHIQSLSKGTQNAILTGVIGISDDEDNKTVVSASLFEPTTTDDISQLFIDDGTGFEPSFTGQGTETLISEAAGTESFLQLGNFPLVKAQATTSTSQPYNLTTGGTLIVEIDGVEEIISLPAGDFNIPSAALATEVAESINNRASTISARTAGGQVKVVIFSSSDADETLQVTGGTANNVLSFPINEIHTLKLYKNDALLSKNGETGILESDDIDNWNTISSPALLNVTINSKPIQYLRLTNSILEVSSDGVAFEDVTTGRTTFSDLGVTLNTATVANWATVLEQIINGATVTPNGDRIRITSDLETSSSSSVLVAAALASEQGWPTTADVGKPSEYTLNRFNGQVELTTALVSGDDVTAGSANTRGQQVSASTSGTYDLTTDGSGRVAALYIVLDSDQASTVTKRTSTLTTAETITVANPGGDTYRYTSSSTSFADFELGDYVVIVHEGGNALNEGIFKIIARTDSSFDVTNPSGVAVGPTAVAAATDIQAFLASVPPQKVSFASAVTAPSAVVTQIQSQIVGIDASTDTDSAGDTFVKLISNKYAVGGALTIPVSAGTATNLAFVTTTDSTTASHFAAVESESEVGHPISSSLGSLTTSDTTDPFTTVTDTTRTFDTDTVPNEWVKYLTGTNRLLKGFIELVTSATVVTLRDNTFTSGSVDRINSHDFLNAAASGELYQQFFPFDLNSEDNIVVIVDEDQISKTSNISLGRSGRVDANASATEINGIDTDASSAGVGFDDSLWLAYDFSDYKIWFKAHRVIDFGAARDALIWRSAVHGPIGEKVRIIYDYPIAASASPSASHSPSSTGIDVTVRSGSGAARTASYDATTIFDISVTAKTITLTHSGGTAPAFVVDGVLIGDIATYSAAAASSGNTGTFQVTARAATAISFSDVADSGVLEGGILLGATAALSIYPLATNTAADLRDAANNDATVSDIVESVLTTDDPNATTNDGTGIITNSTGDEIEFAMGAGDAITVTGAGTGFGIYTRTAGTVDFSAIRPGDVIRVRSGGGGGASPFASANEGSFIVTVGNSATAFTVINTSAFDEVIGAGPFGPDDIWTQKQGLVDGENYIRSFANPATPTFTLKESLIERNFTGGAGFIYEFDTAPNLGTSDTGELFKLIPTVARNIEDHFNKTAISALSLNADVTRSDDGEKVQIVSKVIGSSGSVQVSGGTGNSVSAAVTVNGTVDTGTIKTAVATTSTTGFHPNQTVRVRNSSASRRVNNYDAANSVTVTTGGTFTHDSSASFGSDGTTTITVAAGTGNQFTWTHIGGTAPDFTTAKVGDELFVPAGSPFAAGNEGSFPIVAVSATVLTVINPAGVGEGPITIITPSTDMVGKPPFFEERPVTLGGVFQVEKLSSEFIQFRNTSGTAPEFVDNGVEIDDIVDVVSEFSTENTGVFRVVFVANDRFIVENTSGIEESVTTTSTSMTFRSVNSARIGDDLNISVLASASWFDLANQGVFDISSVSRNATGNHQVVVAGSGFTAETVVLGSDFASFFVTEDDPFEGFRTLLNLSEDPVDSTNTFMWLSPSDNSDRITEAASTSIIAVNKLGYQTSIKVGDDGYKYYTGLLRTVHRTVDGFDPDPVTFPGIKAAGVQIEVLPPLLERIQISLDVRPITGLNITVITNAIKAATLAYISGLGVGEDVVLSRIVEAVQGIPGVASVVVTSPQCTTESITIQDNEKAIASIDDITVS